MIVMKVPLDAKSYLVLRKLLISNTYLNASQLAGDLDISKRSVYYAISRINDYLLNAGISQIEIERKLGILLQDHHKRQIECSLDDVVEAESYILSPMERVRYIVCYIIYQNGGIFVDDLCHRLNVSRNTVFNDLKVVESKLLRYELRIVFNQKDGYAIEGGTINKRAIFLYNFQLLLPLYNSGIVVLGNNGQINLYYYLLKKIEEALHVKYINGTLFSLSILLESYIDHQEAISFADLDAKEISETDEFQLIQEYFPMLIDSERYYLSLHLLGARLQVVPIFSKSVTYDREIYQIASDLKTEFERLACIVFENEDDLLEALYVHLKTSMFRYKYGIVLENPLAEEIIKNYNELFALTKKACDYLQKRIGIPISDSEIAYITLHFGAFLKNRDNRRLRVLVVCPNGLSTGNMLKREISQLVPNVEILEVQSSTTVSNVYELCDLVISTVPIQSDVPSIVVHPILTDIDKMMILNHTASVTRGAVHKRYDVDDIIQTFRRFVKTEEEERFKTAVLSYFGDDGNTLLNSQKAGLKEILTSDRITFVEADDWRMSICKAAAPLLKKRRVSQEYVDKMIQEIEHYGPYNFITENVVLAHAKPIEQNSTLDLSIGISKTPVFFGPKKQANVLLVLSVDQKHSHLNLLKDLMTLFSVQTNTDHMIRLNHADEILDFIHMRIAD